MYSLTLANGIVSKNTLSQGIKNLKGDTMNLKSLVLGIFLLSPSAFAVPLSSLLSPMAEQRPDVPILQPIRYASAHLVVQRRAFTLDPVTKQPIDSVSKVCDLQVPVPVYDVPDSSWGIGMNLTTCVTDEAGTEVKIQSQAQLAYANTSIYKGAPVERYKVASSFSFLSGVDQSIAHPPSQTILSRDLRQTSFIMVARPEQYASCMSKDGEPPKCTIKNPVIYEVIWDIQDTAQ